MEKYYLIAIEKDINILDKLEKELSELELYLLYNSIQNKNQIIKVKIKELEKKISIDL